MLRSNFMFDKFEIIGFLLNFPMFFSFSSIVEIFSNLSIHFFVLFFNFFSLTFIFFYRKISCHCSCYCSWICRFFDQFFF